MSDFQVEAQHVSTTEDEMTQAANIFAKMRDAVIDASHLAGEVAELRKAVGDLRREVEVLRRDNHWLDEQLTKMRKDRDDAITEAKANADEKAYAELNLRNEQSANAQMHQQVASLEGELTTVKRGRDDAEFKSLELSEELEKVKAKLAKVMAVFSEETATPKAAEAEMPKAMNPPDPPKPVQDPEPERSWARSW